MADVDVRVRPVEAGDHAVWRELFEGYRAFYAIAPDDAAVDRVWDWLQDPGHEVGGLVAEVDGRVVGFAHHRLFSRPSEGGRGLYLDDLFARPDVRGRGVGRALIERLAEMARAEGCAKVRWVTAEDNHVAQRLYDAVAQRTTWVTYDLPV
ncbi:MAG: family N-acetyltransferase [Marmoricola sp.]|jgi:GNAT superfamily N-acetyltransferase|nr:family N-acetyltransferase [Marmoricola sp.]